MVTNKTQIFVYAHWLGMPEPKHIGVLSAQQAKGKKAFSFEYLALVRGTRNIAVMKSKLYLIAWTFFNKENHIQALVKFTFGLQPFINGCTYLKAI